MSNNRTCNSSFWSKEEDKILEDTLAIYFTDGGDLLTMMEEALPGKFRDDIINHYKILLEDVEAIDCGRVPLPDYQEMQSHSSQKSRFRKTDLQQRRGVAWTQEEHRHCVISRTPTQVASHAQKYFNRLKAANKENRRASIHDTTNSSAEPAETSQVRSTENMIWPACEGSQPVGSAVASTSNASMFFQESTNAEQVTAVAGGVSSCHSAAFVNGMNCLYPDENDEFILRIDDLIVEPGDATGSGFLVDAERSLSTSKQPCITASTETLCHPITRIGSELEALIAAYMDEGNAIPSIFDAGETPTSHAMPSNAAYNGMCSYPVASFDANNAPWNMASCADASIGANNAPQNTGASYRGMSSFGASSLGAYNAPQTMMGSHSRMTSSAVACFGANNAPPQNIVAAHSGTTSFAVTSFDATNVSQNAVAAHAQLSPVAPSSNFGGGEWPYLNTTIHDEGIFDLDDLFTD